MKDDDKDSVSLTGGRRMEASSETAPLLRQASIAKANDQALSGLAHDYDTIPGYERLEGSSTKEQPSWKREAALLARYSTPLIVTYVLQYSYTFVTVFVAGRLGTSELAAASLATMTANITGLAVYEGLATSLDTLTSQAFGAGKKELVGLHVQRMIALALLVTVPIGAIWLCSPWILAGIVPEKKVAHLAGDFLRFYLIGAPGYGVFEAVKRFTQAQGDFMGPMMTALVCTPVNIFCNWLLVFRLGLGFRGAGIASAVTLLCQPLVFVLYVRLFAPDTLQCWPGLQVKRAFENWSPMVKLALPGVASILAEWLAFDLLTLSSSYLGEQYLAAQSVSMTISVAMYHIPMPIAIAASTRFGNLIGLGDLKSARVAFKTHYIVIIAIGIADILLLTSLRHIIARIFTQDAAVRVLIIEVMPIVAAAQLFDALCALSNALTRGLGRQKVSGYVNLGVYYLFGVPLSLLLTFGPPQLGLIGLWIGPLIGLGVTALILYTYMRYADWSKAVEEARAREE